MAFERPITIREALEGISSHEYVLPAIQREFVWRPDKMIWLLDSLMRGYPMGAFLFWKISPESARRFKFYDFVRDYHRRDSPYCPPLDMLKHQDLLAVLDGQQRLTSLNIALRGSYAEKEPRKWWNNPDAFPVKRLYLNLMEDADPGLEEGLKYDFRFLPDARANDAQEGEAWFKVGDILTMDPGPSMHRFLVENGLGDDTDAFERLFRLHATVHQDQPITYFLEKEQDPDKVLNIFIRVNSGGTPLSYSDLLLSIATAQWDRLDAREAIFGLVDDLNDTRDGFALSKDFVLKAGLMLCDIASVGFRVSNFDSNNMHTLQERWPDVEQALRVTVRLVADFGFNRDTLRADSALLPIAYYLCHRGLGDEYRTSRRYAEDRKLVCSWLIRSLLKPGIWGSGLDVTLTALRSVIQQSGAAAFPQTQIEAELARRGRSLRFEADEVEDLAEMSFSDRRLFPLLALLYPHVDLRNQFHIDHVFPRSRFTKARLREAEVEDTRREAYQELVNHLPNLQLLDGKQNMEKSDQLPADWLRAQYPSSDARRAYCDRNDLGELPESLVEFPAFYEVRKQRIVERLNQILHPSGSVADSIAASG